MTDDVALIKAIQAGDHQAFESLVRRYQRQVANLIYVTMGSRDVDDIAQEVFIRVHRSLARHQFALHDGIALEEKAVLVGFQAANCRAGGWEG